MAAKKAKAPVLPGTHGTGEMHQFSVHKCAEGGPGQKGAIELLAGHDIKAYPGYSPYVGQTGVVVYGSDKLADQVSDILFG